MGVRLLRDLTHALALRIDPHCPARVTEADLPTITGAMQTAGLSLKLEQLEQKSDKRFKIVFNALRKIMASPPSKRIIGLAKKDV